jgi:glutamine synthetase
VKRLRKWVDDGAVDTIIVAGVDLQGRLYGKRCNAEVFLRDLAGGIHTCDCNLGWDVERQLIDKLEFTGWHTGYGDITSVPDPATLRLIPWHEKTALVLCDTCDHDGDPVPVAPRTILKRQLAKAKEMGFAVKAAPELEFFMFRETLDSSRAKGYTNLEVMSRYISDYSIFRSSMDEWVVGPMRRLLDQAGIEVEGSKAEWGHGQMEINLVYTDALEMADRHVLFKNAVREMAALHGVQVTFMAKWHTEHSGNGCHVHMSLWNDQHNTFHDPRGAHQLSDTLRHFLGGMMALTRDLQLFYAPTINSYKRYVDLSFAPVNLTWGGDNRTVAYRTCGHGNSARVENRIPGADANAHLTYAAMIAAGLYGIENAIEPLGPYVQANAYSEAPDAPPLHRTLIQAADALDQSRTARDILGDAVVDHYVGVARWEIENFLKSVTDWERNRYFELM